MAVRHRLIKVAPNAVWAVLADGARYAEWVVNTSASRPARGHWPAKNAAIRCRVRSGPLRLGDETTVRNCEEDKRLELGTCRARHNVTFEPLIHLRHRAVLGRLARVGGP
ncbi:SRPBCC family protein [Streptomyces gilvus]|uniref:SRPBCC family protein n=1 Tax=Streptomyces gilvus TaxID=2920937 RepID=UPI001F0FE054|nr:SRPBCC family protein [Streptomyces sp. CME 23]MCH5677004.1 SRPBCC family protein [Streptomyces sp. CME 23]